MDFYASNWRGRRLVSRVIATSLSILSMFALISASSFSSSDISTTPLDHRPNRDTGRCFAATGRVTIPGAGLQQRRRRLSKLHVSSPASGPAAGHKSDGGRARKMRKCDGLGGGDEAPPRDQKPPDCPHGPLDRSRAIYGAGCEPVQYMDQPTPHTVYAECAAYASPRACGVLRGWRH